MVFARRFAGTCWESSSQFC